MLKIKMVSNDAVNQQLGKRISSRLLSVVRFPLSFRASQAEEEEFDVVCEMLRESYDIEEPEEAAHDYLDLCSSLDSDKAVKLTRGQKKLLKNLLSDYLETAEWVGEDTFEEFDIPDLLQNVKTSYTLNSMGLWRAPRFYSSVDQKDAGSSILHFLGDLKNYKELIA